MALFGSFRNNARRWLSVVAVEGGGRDANCRRPRAAWSFSLRTKLGSRILTPAREMSSLINKTDKLVQVSEEGLNIRLQEWPEAVRLPFVWLRDHCRCDQCYSHVTLQRQAVIDPSWLTLAPSDVTADAHTISLTWPDGHRTTYDLSWLWANSFEGRRHLDRPETTMRRLWNASQLRDLGGVPRVPFQSFVDHEDSVAELIRHLVSVGVCIVEQAPATAEGTRQTVERVCAIQHTLWGSLYTLELNPLGDDLAFSNQALPPHVDGNYLLDGPGLQVFHALEASPTGGETVLVDGFAAASRIPPSDLALLSSTPIVFEYRDKSGKVYLNTDTIFKHDPITGEINHFRFCPNDVAPLASIAPPAILPFYEAYSRLVREVQREEAIFLHRLSPGEVLFVDNWRVMHGRKEFNGRRVLSGCYLGRADYLCRARMLKVID